MSEKSKDAVPAADTPATELPKEDRPEPGETDAMAPRKDFGPERFEDANAPEPKKSEQAKLSAEEVDPEKARKDETTVLASDIFDQEGNRLN